MSRFPKTHAIFALLLALPLTSALLASNPIAHRTQSGAVLDLTPASQMSSLDAPLWGGGPLELKLGVDPGAVPEQGPAGPVAKEIIETVRRGDSLAKLFARSAISPKQLAALMQSGPLAEKLRHIYAGQEVTFLTSPDKELLKLSYSPGRLETLEFERNGDSFGAKRIERVPAVTTTYRHATINQSLFTASQKIGLRDDLTLRLAQIFQWDIDFVFDIRRGDEFSLVFEEQQLSGKFIGYGRILAADFATQGRRYQAVYFEDANGHGDYYTPTGESMRKAFLRAPVEFSRISSNYNPRRLHPIRKRVMPHRGIDYAAPTGTPILAAGDGRVLSAGRTAPNGNYIVLQHGERFQTKYLHLSKFGRGIKRGVRVHQGQVIGYVGATGWATASHLHYEFLVNGVHQNPRTVALPKAAPVPAGQRAKFQVQSAKRLALLSSYKKTELQIAATR